MVPMRLLFVCLFLVVGGCRLNCIVVPGTFITSSIWSFFRWCCGPSPIASSHVRASIPPLLPLGLGSWSSELIKEAFGMINFHPWLHYQSKQNIIQTFAQTLDSSPLVPNSIWAIVKSWRFGNHQHFPSSTWKYTHAKHTFSWNVWKKKWKIKISSIKLPSLILWSNWKQMSFPSSTLL